MLVFKMCWNGDAYYTGRANNSHTPKRTLIFQLSFNQKQNWLLHVKKQSISSMWANFIICILNT